MKPMTSKQTDSRMTRIAITTVKTTAMMMKNNQNTQHGASTGTE